jgi:predicted ATP-dependent protease
MVEIRGVDRVGVSRSSPLLPAPVPVDVKVILIGEPGSFDVPRAWQDPEFLKVFKVHAEFDTTLPLDDEGLRTLRAAGEEARAERGAAPAFSGAWYGSACRAGAAHRRLWGSALGSLRPAQRSLP